MPKINFIIYLYYASYNASMYESLTYYLVFFVEYRTGRKYGRWRENSQKRGRELKKCTETTFQHRQRHKTQMVMVGLIYMYHCRYPTTITRVMVVNKHIDRWNRKSLKLLYLVTTLLRSWCSIVPNKHMYNFDVWQYLIVLICCKTGENHKCIESEFTTITF